MAKFKIDDKVIDTTEFMKGTGIVTRIMQMPNTKSMVYHVRFGIKSGMAWFLEEELKRDNTYDN